MVQFVDDSNLINRIEVLDDSIIENVQTPAIQNEENVEIEQVKEEVVEDHLEEEDQVDNFDGQDGNENPMAKEELPNRTDQEQVPSGNKITPENVDHDNYSANNNCTEINVKNISGGSFGLSNSPVNADNNATLLNKSLTAKIYFHNNSYYQSPEVGNNIDLVTDNRLINEIITDANINNSNIINSHTLPSDPFSIENVTVKEDLESITKPKLKIPKQVRHYHKNPVNNRLKRNYGFRKLGPLNKKDIFIEFFEPIKLSEEERLMMEYEEKYGHI